jgi:hypothetical protein
MDDGLSDLRMSVPIHSFHPLRAINPRSIGKPVSSPAYSYCKHDFLDAFSSDTNDNTQAKGRQMKVSDGAIGLLNLGHSHSTLIIRCLTVGHLA